MMKKFTSANRLILPLGILLSLGTLLSIQQYDKKETLNKYLRPDTITAAKIIKGSDTVTVGNLDAFLSEIGTAKKMGPIKYMKTMEVWFTRENGTNDDLRTNGKVFSYQGYYFAATSDIMTKYLNP